MDDATMLAELQPTAERLVDRHLGMAKSGFPTTLSSGGRHQRWHAPNPCPMVWPVPCSSTC